MRIVIEGPSRADAVDQLVEATRATYTVENAQAVVRAQMTGVASEEEIEAFLKESDGAIRMYVIRMKEKAATLSRIAYESLRDEEVLLAWATTKTGITQAIMDCQIALQQGSMAELERIFAQANDPLAAMGMEDNDGGRH